MSSRTPFFGRSPTTARTTGSCGACRSTRTSSSRSPTNGSFRPASRSDVKFAAVRPVSRVLARELAVTALLLLGVSAVVFAILYLAPGDPLNVLLEGQSPRSELALGMRAALGVPRTWHAQHAAWFGQMLPGNFGNSIRTGRPVLPELAPVGVNTPSRHPGPLVLTPT